MYKYAAGTLFAAALALGGGTVAQASQVIDDYDDPDFALVDTATAGSQAISQPTPSVLGGERDVELETSTNPGSGVATAAIVDGDGVLRFGTDGGTFASLDLIYDAFTGEDLTAGADSFELLLSFVQGEADIQISVNGTSSTAQTVSGSGGPVLLQFAYADAAFAGVDFTSVNSVGVNVTTTQAASDVNFDRLSTAVIPEPASLALMGIGGALLIHRRRREA